MLTRQLKLRKNSMKSMSNEPYVNESHSVYRAYETLSDDSKRKMYDATGMNSNE
jgi:DnaJ-class molecular chaperone